MKKSILFLGLVLLILLIASIGFWLYEAQYLVGRASTVRTGFSNENSYLFVSPLQAKANNQEKIRVTVFVLNNQGLGIQGYKVTLNNHPALAIETIQGLTDGYGKAVFDVSGSKAGDYYLEVYAEAKQLQQKAHLSFK